MASTSEISSIIAQMKSQCTKLHIAQYVRRGNVVMMFLTLLILVPVILSLVYGPDVGGLAAAVSFLVLVLAFYCVCIKLPWSRTMVSELDRLAAELRDRVEALRRSLEPERSQYMFPMMYSKWQSLEHLEKVSVEVVKVVDTLRSVVNSYLINELKKKLQQCQEHLCKI